MEAERSAAEPADHDAEWTTRHPRLDRSLAAAIHAPVVDEPFDDQVWALIRADEPAAEVTQLRMGLGPPWWLDCLNVLAIAVTAVALALALALRTVASTPVPETVAAAVAFVELPPDSVRALALIASGAALWFGLRHVPFVRALVRP